MKFAEFPIVSEVLYEDEFIKMYLDIPNKCIVKEWRQNPSMEKFKILIMHLVAKIINVRTKYNISINLLADCRNLSAELFSEEVIEWLNEKIHKTYVLSEVRKKAFVASDIIACNTSIQEYIQKSSGVGLEMKLFDSIQEALHWLNQ